MTIEAGLYSFLTTQISGLKLYPQIAPETQAPPYVVYSRDGTDRWRTFASEGQFVASFNISVYATTYSAMVALKNSIRVLLEAKTGTLATGSPYVQAIEIDNEIDMYELDTKYHHGVLDITIFHT